MSDRAKAICILGLFLFSGFLNWCLDEPEALQAWQEVADVQGH